MFIKESLIKHFTKPNNAVIYVLLLFVFILEVLDDGIGRAILVLAVIGYLYSGFRVVLHMVFSVRYRNFKIGSTEIVSYGYFVMFAIYAISEIGFSQKAIVLVLPLVLGLIIASVYLFMETDIYKRMDKWERRKLKKWFSPFRKKT